MSNNADIIMNNTTVNISQKTDYPWSGRINISINPEKKKKFTVKLRIPGWARNQVIPGTLYDISSKLFR